MRFLHQLFASHAVLAASMPPLPLFIAPPQRGPMPSTNRIRTGNRYRPNGKRECARRRRQIEAGQIQVTGGISQ